MPEVGAEGGYNREKTGRYSSTLLEKLAKENGCTGGRRYERTRRKEWVKLETERCDRAVDRILEYSRTQEQTREY